jgi:hypothetical protein
VASTVGCGREEKGRTEKCHACAFWGKGGAGGKGGEGGGGGSGMAVSQGSRKGGWGSRLSDDRRKEGRGCGSDRRAAAADNTPAAVHAGGRCSDRGCGRLAGGALAPSPPVDSIRF